MGCEMLKYLLVMTVFLVIKTRLISCQHFTNSYAIHIDGDSEVARTLASKHGFVYVDQIMPGYYHMRHQRIARRSVLPDDHYHKLLIQEPNVKWVQQQVAKKRAKRDIEFNDPQWPKEWYLHRGSGLDMNVLQAFKWGMTGQGVVVSILDDGIEKDHPDLMKNYDPGASYDVNEHDNDPQPRYDFSNENRTGHAALPFTLIGGPKSTISTYYPASQFTYGGFKVGLLAGPDSSSTWLIETQAVLPFYATTYELYGHGTRCAGEVAAEANNNICNVGIAYNARIGGVRMLDGEVTDAVEAQSLALNQQHIDVYSASWGPDDDGRTVDGPGPLARKAFLDGISAGRRGLGSIFVWASGNGGSLGDNCNCDGYTNSIYTLSISSASENGNVPWYSEACSSTLATTYSSGGPSERQISTTDLRKLCTDSHTGTSASAPLAAGVCALALEANPLLTWRDMQHVVVLTAQRANLKADDWVLNGAGRYVSHHFGYGMMDAGAMVELAMAWKTVPFQRRCEVPSHVTERTVPINGIVEVTLTTDACVGDIRYLEHVEAVVTLSASVRGQVELHLTSPAGTRSTLLAQRNNDRTGDGFNAWPFMTTHNWGESPLGVWRLEVRNGASVATLKDWSLVFYGTKEDPQPPKSGKRYLLEPGTGTCNGSEYVLGKFCYTSCPRLFYPADVSYDMLELNGTIQLNVSIKQCLRCHSSCEYCSGPSEDQCFNCTAFHYLTSGNRCYSTVNAMLPSWRPAVVFSMIAMVGFFSLTPVVVWLAVVNCKRRRISKPVTEDAEDLLARTPFMAWEENEAAS